MNYPDIGYLPVCAVCLYGFTDCTYQNFSLPKKRFTKPVIIKPFPRKSLLFYNIKFRLLFWTVYVHAACRCTIYGTIRIRHCSSQRPVPSVRAWHVQSYLFHTFQQMYSYQNIPSYQQRLVSHPYNHILLL